MVEAEVSIAGRRVLVVEDEYWLAAEITAALKGEGAEVIGPVGTLPDAQRLLASERPDCAILDVNLHGEMAFPIAESLQEADVPFAIASGYDEQAFPPVLANVPRLQKPFAPSELKQLLPRLIESAASR